MARTDAIVGLFATGMKKVVAAEPKGYASIRAITPYHYFCPVQKRQPTPMP